MITRLPFIDDLFPVDDDGMGTYLEDRVLEWVEEKYPGYRIEDIRIHVEMVNDRI